MKQLKQKSNKKRLQVIKEKLEKEDDNKKESGHKTADLKKLIRWKRSTKAKDLFGTGGKILQRGRPHKFNSPDELLEFFNLYLVSLQERIAVAKEAPSEIYDREINKEYKKLTSTHIKGYTIDTKIEYMRVFKENPSKLGFYVFIGGMSSDTWTEYKKKKEFSETIELIENYLESVIENGALSGKINPTIAVFVLNTTYGRIPKSLNLEKEYIPTDDEKKKLDDLISQN